MPRKSFCTGPAFLNCIWTWGLSILPLAGLPATFYDMRLWILISWFALVSQSWQASTLGERDFLDLSQAELSALTSTPDPKRAINLEDPTSHLSKILIPRARTSSKHENGICHFETYHQLKLTIIHLSRIIWSRL
jgi:hypothetical protein